MNIRYTHDQSKPIYGKYVAGKGFNRQQDSQNSLVSTVLWGIAGIISFFALFWFMFQNHESSNPLLEAVEVSQTNVSDSRVKAFNVSASEDNKPQYSTLNRNPLSISPKDVTPVLPQPAVKHQPAITPIPTTGQLFIDAVKVDATASVIQPETKQDYLLKMAIKKLIEVEEKVDSRILSIMIKQDMSLSTIFQNKKLSPQDLYKILDLSEHKKVLYNLHLKQKIDIEIDSKRNVLSMVINMNIEKALHIKRNQYAEFDAEVVTVSLDKKIKTISGYINKSLSVDGMQAGLELGQIKKLSEIFQHHLDFTRVLDKGDQFIVYLDVFMRDGLAIKVGDIVAAEIINKGKLYQVASKLDGKGKLQYDINVFTLSNDDETQTG